MPYPNTNVLNIVIPQTSASIDGLSTQAPFVERIISGSRLVLQTDTTGTLIGSSDLNVNNITASNVSASNTISASNLWVQTSIVDGGTLTVLGNTVLGDTVSDIIRITGSTSLSGSFSVVGASTFNGLVSASAGLTASAIQDAGTLTVVGNTIVANLSASNISASRIVVSEITASNELFVGTGPAYRTYGEAYIPENIAKLYVSGSVSVVSKYATLTLATSASATGSNSSILFARLNDRNPGTGLETVLEPRMQIGVDSGSNDLRFFAYYVSDDPDNNPTGANIVAGTRAILKQSGYFGVGNFISYGSLGGAKTTYVSSLPGYTDVTGPDALLTILPMDSASFGSPSSKQFNRNILNIMSYDTSSIMFISGSDGYVLLGRNTTDGFNRLQVAGNVSASAYTGSSANFTSLITSNITASNISASGNVSSSTLVVTGVATFGSVVITNLTASNISASGNISSSTLYVVNNATINGDLTVNGGDIVLSNTATNISLLDNVGNALDIKEAANSYIKVATTDANPNVTFGTTPTVYLIKTTDNDLLTYDNGALIIGGGVGINKNLFVGANTYTVGNSSITGSLTVGTTLRVNGNSILGDALTDVNTSSGSLRVLNTTNNDQSTYTNGALIVDGGVGIGKNLFVSGSMFVGGDFTVFGSSSVVYISSSTVIINDNIIQLNAFFPYERYAGFEVFDSGSNQRSASLLWDGLNDNWTTVDQNNSASNIIIGPTASFGSAIPNLTVNRLTKAYEGNGITDSLVSDDGTTLRYTGNVISASSITASYGTVTYITGALVTYVTGSFNILQVSTGSSPGTGQVPGTPTANGFVGQITVDNNFIYVYTGNIWKRVPISNWAP